MRHLLALATTIVLSVCGSPPLPGGDSGPQDAPTDAAVEFLITSAATDFRRQQSPWPVRFRAVRSGYVVTAGGARQYRLCGEYAPGDQGGGAEWIAFATIRTSSYEQWLGGQALTVCRDTATTWDKEDLSPRLLGRFNSAGKASPGVGGIR